MRKYAGYHTKKNIETSKKLTGFAVAMVIFITIVTVIAVFVLEDVTPLEFLITGIFGLASASFGFYFWKAKNENIAKYGNNVEEPEQMCYTEDKYL